MPVSTIRFAQGTVPPTPPAPAALRLAGPVVPVQIEVPSLLAKHLASVQKPVPPPVTGLALVDTGATSTAVNESTASGLGVSPVGTATVGTAGGSHLQPVFPLKITLPQSQMSIEYEQVMGADLSGCQVMGQQLLLLIGRDVLERMILIYDGPGGQFTLAF